MHVFVAGFIGSPAMNLFQATVESANGRVDLNGESFTVEVPEDRAEELRDFVGRRLTFGVRPENLHDPRYVPTGIQAVPVKVRVDVTELMGNEVFLHLLAGDVKFLARVDPRTELSEGQEAEIMIDLERMHVFDPESEEVLKTGAGRRAENDAEE